MIGNWLWIPQLVRTSEVVNPGLLTSKFIVIASHKVGCCCWHLGMSESVEGWGRGAYSVSSSFMIPCSVFTD